MYLYTKYTISKIPFIYKQQHFEIYETISLIIIQNY